MKRPVLAVFLALWAQALGAQTVIRVGAVTAIPGIFDPIQAHLEKERGIHLVFTEKTGTEMLADVQEGKLDVAVAGITMEGWLEAMQKQGRPVKPLAEYKHLQIGTDKLSVLVNPDVVTDIELLVREISKEDIKKLFTARIKNWKELGGPDLPVVVLLSQQFVTTAKVFQDKALDGEPFTADCVRIEGGIRGIAPALIKTKGAITIGPLALTRNSKIWSPTQAPRIERPFTMVISSTLSPEAKKAVASMVEFILGPGQEYIQK